MSSVRPSNSGCTRIVGRARRYMKCSVRDVRGAAESISSYLSALPIIQMHPELDGRTLDIVHCFYNIARHLFLFSVLIKLQIILTVRVQTKNRTTCFSKTNSIFTRLHPRVTK